MTHASRSHPHDPHGHPHDDQGRSGHSHHHAPEVAAGNKGRVLIAAILTCGFKVDRDPKEDTEWEGWTVSAHF